MFVAPPATRFRVSFSLHGCRAAYLLVRCLCMIDYDGSSGEDVDKEFVDAVVVGSTAASCLETATMGRSRSSKARTWLSDMGPATVEVSKSLQPSSGNA